MKAILFVLVTFALTASAHAYCPSKAMTDEEIKATHDAAVAMMIKALKESAQIPDDAVISNSPTSFFYQPDFEDICGSLWTGGLFVVGMPSKTGGEQCFSSYDVVSLSGVSAPWKNGITVKKFNGNCSAE